MDTYLNLLLLAFLILLSGLFSASETALSSFRTIHLDRIESTTSPTVFKYLKQWFKKSNEMLIALLIGNNVVNILASSLATVLIINYIGNSGKSILLTTLIITILILIFGEITPKVIAKNNVEAVSKAVIIFVYWLSVIGRPFIFILMGISKIIGRIFGINMEASQVMLTEEDLISFVNVGEAEGIIEEDEKEMIHSIVGFAETSCKEIMTPRTSMFVLEGSKTIDEVWEELLESGFSRVPIYDNTIDSISGILYIKDILESIKNGDTAKPVKNFVREAFFVPETKSIIELLKEFQKLKVHIAMIIDEYGGIVGLLTIEDLVEEIIGEIQDEFDIEEELIRKIDDKKYKIDAMIDIELLNKELEINLPDTEDYESLGGLIVTTLGRVAKVGDEILITNVKLRVLEVDKMRVSKVLLIKEEINNT